MSDPLENRDETPIESDPALAPGGSDPSRAETPGEAATRATLLQELQSMVEGALSVTTPATPAHAILEASDTQENARLVIGHIAQVAHCYPGDELRFTTRITPLEEIAGYTLRVTMPEDVEIVTLAGPPSADIPVTETGGIAGIPTYYLRWQVTGPFLAGQRCEHVTTVRVQSHSRAFTDGLLPFGSPPITSTAQAIPFARVETEQDAAAQSAVQTATQSADEDGARETMVVEIRPKGAYLRYLPALYERDPLVSRFLMLFESFWAPIQMQIGGISDYFDPRLMPLPVLHWLAAHLDLVIEEGWPEETQRRMLASAVSLYRKRGTRYGLQRLLEIYTSGTVMISEHRANNFRMGAGARLGQGIALGARNQPFTFSVRITAPPIVTDPARSEDADRLRRLREKRIRTLIDAEKPAHVTYTLDIQEAQPG